MPRFRTGRSIALNVYDGDVPVFQAHSIESAAELVELLNAGHHPRPCAADRALYEARCEIGRWHDALADLMTYFDAGHHPGDERMEEIRALMAAHRPPDRPESPTEPTGAQEEGLAPCGPLCACGHSAGEHSRHDGWCYVRLDVEVWCPCKRFALPVLS